MYKDVPAEDLKKLRVGDVFEDRQIVGMMERYYGFTMIMSNGDLLNAHKKTGGTYNVHVITKEKRDEQKARRLALRQERQAKQDQKRAEHRKEMQAAREQREERR
jgi:hypothetical protein